ncbi:OmpA family protein [Zobellella endophytica]|uniref:OmpA family protein n=1 Tax=Zobellella endophytica TaxID=2116700 RepID=A0A2P7QQG0_9GAMM|nr:OmpA family protein [Zobellella endophytica]PSJ40192.1 OmpA family protein [Zobellella endophytica]
MKTWMLVALLLSLAGCTLTAEPEQETVAAYDLTDPDWDGVINAREQCADTPEGAEVDNDGCQGGMTQALRQDLMILFAHDSAVITPQYRNILEEMAAFMNEHPEQRLLLEGHASQVGAADYNVALSKRRAEAVRGALIEAGIGSARLDIIGYGETQPILMGEGEQAAAANRRVVGALTSSRDGIRMRWTVYSVEG